MDRPASGCPARPAQLSPDAKRALLAKLLQEKEKLRRADPQRGKFRSYLLGGLKHFLADHSDHLRAAKRGGGIRVASTRTTGEGLASQFPQPHTRLASPPLSSR